MKAKRFAVKQFAVERIPIEVEYIRPVLGRLYVLLAFARTIRVVKIRLTIGDKPLGKVFYRLYVPKIVNKGASG